MLTHFSLFTGIGGLDLAAEWAGIATIGQCEWADYPTKVLEKHWPDVPRWRDIREVTAEDFYERTGLRTVTVVSGGFPCQPFSTAGKRRGKEDDRYLWPEMFRVIKEVQPRWVVAENVPGIVKQALDTICGNLENTEYTVWPIIISSYCAGAMFKGERIFILAQANNRGGFMRWNRSLSTAKKTEKCWNYYRRGETEFIPGQWEKLESRPYGVAYGVPNRVDRLKCLGNAVVPQQAYPIFQAIADIEVERAARSGI